jgi:hypothetical protein
MNRRAFLVGIAGAATLLAGCNQMGTSDSETTGTLADTPAQTPTNSTTASTATATANLVSNPDIVRSCGTSVSASAFDDNRNTESIRAGPLIFVDAEQWLSSKAIVNDLWVVKLPAFVKAGAVVTLVVPEAERKHVALNYEGNTISSLKDGQLSVRFKSCDSVELTAFPGGIVTTGSQRVSLTVWINGEEEPRDVTLPVGARYWE